MLLWKKTIKARALQASATMLSSYPPDWWWVESLLAQAHAQHPAELIKTGSPNFLCSALPTHWRSNKTLPVAFKVNSIWISTDCLHFLIRSLLFVMLMMVLLLLSMLAMMIIMALSWGTTLPRWLMEWQSLMIWDLLEGLEEVIIIIFKEQFINTLLTGKNFNLTITVHSRPLQVTVYTKCIKVTVDGPRHPRNNKSKFNLHLLIIIKHTSSRDSLPRVVWWWWWHGW